MPPLRLLVGAVALLVVPLLLAGCGGDTAAEKKAAAEAAERQRREGLGLVPEAAQRPEFESNAPLVIVAETAERPNVLTFNLFNRTQKEVPLQEAYFGLIIDNRRPVRGYRHGIDWAYIAGISIPPGGQAIGRIEWNDVPPLAGQKLVFNPEGSGLKPIFCVITTAPIAAPVPR